MNKNYNNQEETEEDNDTGKGRSPEGGGVTNAIEFWRGEVGDDGVFNGRAGGVFGEFGQHTIDVRWAIPAPAVSDSLRLTDRGRFGVNVAVRVGVGGKLSFGVFEGFSGGTIVLLFKIKNPGTKIDFSTAILFCNINHDMIKGKILQVFEALFESSDVARLVGGDDGITKFNHLKMI